MMLFTGHVHEEIHQKVRGWYRNKENNCWEQFSKESHFPLNFMSETVFPFVSGYLFKYIFMEKSLEDRGSDSLWT